MQLTVQTASLHTDSPTLNKVKGQSLLSKYTVTDYGVSKANTLLRHISTVRYIVVSKSSVAKLSGLTGTQSHTTGCVSGNGSNNTASLAYHPLVDLTPFSAATAGWAVRKLGRGRKCQEKHTIIFHSKLLKRKNWVTFKPGIEDFFVDLWTCSTFIFGYISVCELSL